MAMTAHDTRDRCFKWKYHKNEVIMEILCWNFKEKSLFKRGNKSFCCNCPLNVYMELVFDCSSCMWQSIIYSHFVI